jgi:hypothetical protein
MAFTATDCTADQINYRVCIAINYRDQLHLVRAGEAKVLKPRRRWLNLAALPLPPHCYGCWWAWQGDYDLMDGGSREPNNPVLSCR